MIYNIHELSWCWKFQNNPLYPHPKRKVISPHQCNFNMSTKTVKNIREPLKKPRPLKSSTSVESPKDALNTKARADLLAELEILNVRISNCDLDEIVTADIALMCSLLKRHGEELDSVFKEALDRFFSTLRNICREDRLDAVSRLKLLEVIEMRAMRWRTNENVTHYFTTKLSQLEDATERLNLSGSISPNTLLNSQSFSNANNVALAPGEVLRSSGKFSKPTKIAGKNYYKDEIVIRNCDSGKVMGIKGRRVHMIEELSDTVISFQRVNAGARDRLVQITGPHEESISHAKYLVEDTIKRNVSPVRDNLNLSELSVDNKESVDYGTSYFDRNATSKRNLAHSYSMSDATSREFNVPVHVGNDVIMLSGTKPELLKTAKTVLTEYFAFHLEPLEKENSLFQPKTTSPNNNQRFGLKKQTSLKDNLPASFGPVDQSFSRQSSSSMSSSSDDILADEESSELEALPAPIPPPTYPSPRIYKREFLLECARFPYSQKKPPNYEQIAANFPEIIPQSPVMFDPSQCLQKQPA